MPKKKKDKKAGDHRSIAIDLDVHRLVEANRRDFGESENAILRRLLGLDGAGVPAAPPARPLVEPGRRATGGVAAEGGWSKIGRHGSEVFLPNGTELRAAYAGKRIEGRIEDGHFLVAGERYASPSAAIIAAAATRQGKRTNLNGWRLWEVRRPGDTGWVRLGEL